MPNWCNNYITITGDADKIKKIGQLIELSKREGEGGLFMTLVGIPEGITPAQHNTDWWDIHISYWGCKWDITTEDHSIDIDENYIGISCETAWSPPIPFCQKVAEMFGVDVKITYEEGGMGFAGQALCYPDGTQEDTEYEYDEGMYHLNKDEFWDSIVPNFLEGFYESIDEEGEPTDIKEELSKHFHFCTAEELETILNEYNEEYANND